MSIEALWYSMMQGVKEPSCARYSRLPMQEQFALTIDLAITWAAGQSGYRNTHITSTREQYWFVAPDSEATAILLAARAGAGRNPAAKLSGWWLIPDRIAKRIFALYDAATREVWRRHGPMASGPQIEAVLRRWKATGAWRRHGSLIPRRELIAPVIPRWSRTGKGRPRKTPEAAVCECGRRWQYGPAVAACRLTETHRARTAQISRTTEVAPAGDWDLIIALTSPGWQPGESLKPEGRRKPIASTMRRGAGPSATPRLK